MVTRLWNFDCKGPGSATKFTAAWRTSHRSAKPPSFAGILTENGNPAGFREWIICLWGSLTGPQHNCSLFKEPATLWRGMEGFVRKKWEGSLPFGKDFPPLVSSCEVDLFRHLAFLLCSLLSSVFTSRLPFNVFLVVPYLSKLTGFPCFFLRMHLLSDTTIHHDKPQNVRRSGQSQNHCLVCIHLCIEIKTWASTSAFVNMI